MDNSRFKWDPLQFFELLMKSLWIAYDNRKNNVRLYGEKILAKL